MWYVPFIFETCIHCTKFRFVDPTEKFLNVIVFGSQDLWSKITFEVRVALVSNTVMSWNVVLKSETRLSDVVISVHVATKGPVVMDMGISLTNV